MSDTSEKVRFIRLRSGDDLVAYTIELPTSLVIRRPIGVAIETLMEVNKQIVTMYEWLSPAIAEYETLTIDMNDVMFCLPVQVDFETRYLEMSDILFDPVNYEDRMTRKKNSRKKKKDEEVVSSENITEKKESNVVSFADVLADMLSKKDKPVH